MSFPQLFMAAAKAERAYMDNRQSEAAGRDSIEALGELLNYVRSGNPALLVEVLTFLKNQYIVEDVRRIVLERLLGWDLQTPSEEESEQ